MALTRDQFDVIANSYNDRQLNNKIKLNRRIEEVYEKIPLIKDLDGQIGVLAGRALRLSLSGNSSAENLVNALRQRLSDCFIPVLSLRRFLNARTLILLNMICILMTTLIPIQGFPQQKILTLLWTIVIIL